MIRREDLIPIGKLKGIPPRFAELDYLQEIALLSIEREFGNRLIFKGGTCMYKAYKLDRFSEDLDFTAGKGFKPKDFFRRLPFFFGLLGIRCSVRDDQFEKGMNAYLEASGPLYDGRKESRAVLIFNISLKEGVLLPPQRIYYSPIYQELRPFDLFVMDEKEILAEKIRSVFEREKARDIYDIWHLFKRRGLSFDVSLANRKMARIGLKFEKGRFMSELEKKKTSWGRDLGGLVAGALPPFSQARREIEEKL
jgi:predicted nucleotidyltransferase component of viral defense system